MRADNLLPLPAAPIDPPFAAPPQPPPGEGGGEGNDAPAFSTARARQTLPKRANLCQSAPSTQRLQNKPKCQPVPPIRAGAKRSQNQPTVALPPPSPRCDRF